MKLKEPIVLGAAATIALVAAAITAAGPVTAAPLPAGATAVASPTAGSAGPLVHYMAPVTAASSSRRGGGGTSNLTYHGGSVETSPTVILDFWGSQWNSDGSGYMTYLTNFLQSLGTNGEAWSASTSQYCSGISSGMVASSCSTTNTVGLLNGHQVLKVISDNSTAAPSSPTQTLLAQEAVKVAGQVPGVTPSTQVVVATSHGNNASGFGTQYCAWHSSTSFGSGSLSYTNLPYMTDAGASCGQNYVNPGSQGTFDGVSIVEGHELAETMTDPFPNNGWLDGSGKENGDKCAWISPTSTGGAANITLLVGTVPSSFAVQTLWSDTFNNNTGGCVLSYTASSQQQ